MEITIRSATRDDADSVVKLELEFEDYLSSIGDTYPTSLDRNTYLEDGFGEDAAFSGLVAETGGNVIGYLLYHPGYDVDRGGRTLHVIDLFVTEQARGKGVGRALMETTAEICREAGGVELIWAVFLKNKLAMTFYEKLGARYLHQEDMTYMHWSVRGK